MKDRAKKMGHLSKGGYITARYGRWPDNGSPTGWMQLCRCRDGECTYPCQEEKQNKNKTY